jgi:ankyrin repeat protein
MFMGRASMGRAPPATSPPPRASNAPELTSRPSEVPKKPPAAPNGYEEIHWAAAQCNLEKIRQLLCSPGFDSINAKTDNGWTALHIAARSGYAVTLEVLLSDARTDVCLLNNDGQTALDIASDCGHTAAVECLLAHGGADDMARQLANERLEQEVRRDRRVGSVESGCGWVGCRVGCRGCEVGGPTMPFRAMGSHPRHRSASFLFASPTPTARAGAHAATE